MYSFPSIWAAHLQFDSVSTTSSSMQSEATFPKKNAGAKQAMKSFKSNQ